MHYENSALVFYKDSHHLFFFFFFLHLVSRWVIFTPVRCCQTEIIQVLLKFNLLIKKACIIVNTIEKSWKDHLAHFDQICTTVYSYKNINGPSTCSVEWIKPIRQVGDIHKINNTIFSLTIQMGRHSKIAGFAQLTNSYQYDLESIRRFIILTGAKIFFY